MGGAVFLCLAVATAAGAEVYRWTDAQGQVHFADRPPVAGQAADRVEPVEIGPINTFEGVRVEPAGSDEPVALAKRPSGSLQVVMYSADWCGVCRRAKAFFAERGIAYRERNIETDASARSEYERLGGRGVPLILVGEGRMSGFSPEGFLALYSR